ncbi:type I polyketide synthase [Actinoplanes ianthinogenes]|uniref:type I polyketide synthase n=1 Tax=Actinoplanes ianthinogenes TaxID=122358 RepID=UPI003F683278
MRAENDQLTAAAAEPVAIVGMACRFPGGMSSPEALWEAVLAGRDGVGEWPADRGWDTETIYDPEPGKPGHCVTRHGGFLYDAADFDPELFGISPREALEMDPQQRLLLETSWEALERTGIDPTSLRGSSTGMFAGVMYHDYPAGAAGSIVSGRVSYVLGLEGPAVTVDTACSSSLVALHLAIQSLRTGECSLALAGGVTVMSTPTTFIEFSEQRGLAPDGRCKPFAGGADGTGWGEGVGVLVVERLADARRLGHDVLAVVRGSAINQDGASSGLTVPNGPAQQRVIRAALSGAGLAATEVDVVEAHGTGTTLGDPIEAQALIATYGKGRPADRPLWLGSIKSNIGHTQAAAGVAGIIKMVQAMRHGVVPKTLHVDQPSPMVDWAAGEVRLLTEAVDWPAVERPRRAAVSSFGLSGTNAHVIVEQAPAVAEQPPSPPGHLVPLLVSARTPAARDNQIIKIKDFPGTPVDVAHTLLTARAQLPHRAALVGDAPAIIGEVTTGATAVLFTGQGSQRLGMGRDLYQRFPVFAAAFDAAGAAVKEIAWGTDADELARTVNTQPAIFAFEVALYRLLESWGVRPDFLAGHSIGEIAAAHVAGVLSLEDAGKLVAARGRLMQALPAGGVMVAVAAPESAIELIPGVDIAAVNGPSSVVLSGTAEAVEAVVATLGVKATRLNTSHAFHSHLMEPMLEDFRQIVRGLTFREPVVPVLCAGDVTSPDYWVEHVRATVRFHDVVTGLLGRGVVTFLECGPDATLTGLGRQITGDATFIGLQHRTRPEETELLTGLATAWTRGVDIDWTPLLAGGRKIDLPTYAFDRHRFWPDTTATGADPAAIGLTRTGHPLLGAVIPAPESGGVVLTGRLALDTHPWLADHEVLGSVLLPGTAYVDLALRAGDEAGCPVLADLVQEAPLVLPARGGVRLQVVVGERTAAGARPVQIWSRPEQAGDDAAWLRHASGELIDGEPATAGDLAAWPPPGARPLDLTDGYDRLHAGGYGYGPVFQGLRAAWQHGDDLYAEVELPEPAHDDALAASIHPALLDAAMHAELLRDTGDGEGTQLPFAWTGVTLHATGATAVRVRISHPAPDRISLLVADPAGQPVLTVGSLVSRPMTADRLAPADPADALLGVTWSPAATPDPGATADVVFIYGPDDLELIGAEAARLAVVASVTPSPGGDPPARGGETVIPGASRNATVAAGAPGTVPSRSRETVVAGLRLVQSWLGRPELNDSRLVLVTHRAVPVGADEDVDVTTAPVWGLVRAAQAEHPDRIVLLDTDTGPDRELGGPLLDRAIATGEPELAIRGGELFVPRLAPAAVTGGTAPWAEGVVLITGGTGGLGAILAEHLVRAHGVRKLVLTSRRGPDAPGAAALIARLADLGGDGEAVACDVADRAAVARLIDGIGDRLTGIVHAAGIGDNALLDHLDAARIGTVFAPKADAAWYLHELTAGLPIRAFVLLSSAGGLVLAAGQGNYAAANTFLDALAAHRRHRGLPATALAYGLWDAGSGLAAELTDGDRERMRRLGLPALTTPQALELFDRAVASDAAHLVPLPVDRGALRARTDEPPALLRGLAAGRRTRTRAAAGGTAGTLRDRLAGRPEADRDRQLLQLVREQVAAVLGHASADQIAPERPFSDLGFDSLTAVELRNALSAATGLRLPATLVFDHPTAAATARLLRDELLGVDTATPAAAPVAVTDGDPIAIVAMACRYPGGVSSPEDLWRLVADGVDAVGEFPADRGWDLDGIYDPEPGKPGRSYTRHGAFLYDAAEFDPALFEISPREAAGMDPQQRLLLEVAWETVERAGLDPTALRGSDTGVFTGVMYHDYAGGAAGSIVSGRVSYALGLEGPSVSVDTACSSSLVALHFAMQALRGGECSLALAGGVTVMSTPEMLCYFSEQRGLAPDGRCKSFAGGADGTGWGEGAGLLLLERLSDAQRNGHPVLAVIRGSAVNQDGASNGLTAPNGPAQRRVIRNALATAGLTGADVDVVEAHGTGTVLGDPIEAQALLATYGQDRPEQPLLLGSIKSNIGHTQAAAGVAGIIKVVEAMRHGVVPKTLHVDEPSPVVDWSAGNVQLVTEALAWPSADRPRRAAVSSFGLSGTNAHVIVEQAPATPTAGITSQSGQAPSGVAATSATWGPLPVAISARTPGAVAGGAAKLGAVADGSVADLAWSSFTSRAALEHRMVVLASDSDELRRKLADRDAIVGSVVSGSTAMLFTGQGSQRLGMGRDLYERFPVFAAAFDAAGAAVKDIAWGTDAELLAQTANTQPAIFAFEVALYRLLESWGIRPDYVAGHSIGEIAAAHVAGVLSLEDAVKLVAARGRLMQALPAGGVMVAVAAPESAIDLIPGVDIAAVNGPSSVVLSGTAEAVDALVAFLGVKATKLNTSHAFHSHLMEPMLAEFRQIVQSLDFSEPAIPLITVGDVTDPDYWVDHVRDTVRFHDVVTDLVGRGVTTFLEVGPDSTLTGLGRRIADDATFIALQHRTRENELLTGLATAWTRGVPIDWTPLLAGGRTIALPTYAFDRRRFWMSHEPGARTTPVTVVAAEDTTDPNDLRRELAALPAGDGDRMLLRLVRTHVAAVLGHSSIEDVAPDRPFKELGFDSNAAVELRNRLNAATGVTLPATLVFDHPTAEAVAALVRDLLTPRAADPVATVLAEVDRLDELLTAADTAGGRSRVTTRLEALLRRWQHGAAVVAEPELSLDDASDEELFAALDNEFEMG